jgi:hypothetical protein
MDHASHPTFSTVGLFTPGRLGPYTLPHRLLMAPMTRNRARRDGVPSPSAVIYYAQRRHDRHRNDDGFGAGRRVSTNAWHSHS